MANEVSLAIGSFTLDDATNKIAIEDLNFAIAKSIRESDTPKSHGSIVAIGKRRAMRVRVRGTIIGTAYDNLRSNLDNLKAAIEDDAYQKLTTDDDRFLWVQYGNFNHEPLNIRTFNKFSFDMIAEYPFWLSATLNSSSAVRTSGVAFNVTNAGNAIARAKITITNGSGSTATDDLRIDNNTTGERFQYRGALLNTKALVVNNLVDARDLAVENDGVDDIADFEGDFISLNPGVNSLVLTTSKSGITVAVAHRDTWF